MGRRKVKRGGKEVTVKDELEMMKKTKECEEEKTEVIMKMRTRKENRMRLLSR